MLTAIMTLPCMQRAQCVHNDPPNCPAFSAKGCPSVLQKLVEAKLKRVHAEGLAARGAGQDPLQSGAEDSEATNAHCNGSAAPDEASAARADANMAALLAEVDLEGEG